MAVLGGGEEGTPSECNERRVCLAHRSSAYLLLKPLLSPGSFDQERVRLPRGSQPQHCCDRQRLSGGREAHLPKNIIPLHVHESLFRR